MKIFRTNLLATRFSKVNLIVAATFFTVFCVYYIIMILTNTSSDIPTHVNIAYSFAVNHDKLFPNFLYYLLVAFLSGFSKNIYIYFIVAIILLAASLTAKLLITKLYLEKYIPTHNYNKPTRLLLAIMLLFVFALPGWNLVTSHQFYLGQLTPNVWHNSTIIFLMPFAIVLFFKSYDFLFLPISPQSKKQRAEIAVLIVINALIKPSFLFTLLPAVFFIFFYHRFFTKHTTRFAQLLPYFLGIVFILGEYLLIYKLNYVSRVVQSADSSGDVGFAPFEVWRHFSNNIPLSIITSLLFPIIYIVLTGFSPLK